MRIRLALLLLPLALGVAAVAKPSFPTKLSIHYHFDEMTNEFVFDGKVRSDKQRCVTDRKVRLYNENIQGSLGRDRAEETGSYEIRIGADGLGSDYYTKVRRLVRPGYACKGDESRKVGPG